MFRPHLRKPRKIVPGQLVHETAFGYERTFSEKDASPWRARLPEGWSWTPDQLRVQGYLEADPFEETNTSIERILQNALNITELTVERPEMIFLQRLTESGACLQWRYYVRYLICRALETGKWLLRDTPRAFERLLDALIRHFNTVEGGTEASSTKFLPWRAVINALEITRDQPRTRSQLPVHPKVAECLNSACKRVNLELVNTVNLHVEADPSEAETVLNHIHNMADRKALLILTDRDGVSLQMLLQSGGYSVLYATQLMHTSSRDRKAAFAPGSRGLPQAPGHARRVLSGQRGCAARA